MVCLSLLWAIQRRACVRASISVVKLEIEVLQGYTVFMDGGRTLLCGEAPP